MLADANGRRSYIYQEAYDDVENHTFASSTVLELPVNICRQVLYSYTTG
jgi:hypothetical protein